MFNSYPLKVSQIITLTAIAIILAGWHDSKSVNNFSHPAWASDLPIKDRKIVPLEQLAFERVNQYRASVDLAPLKWNPQISQQARIHSDNMAKAIAPFSHDGFESRIKALKDTVSYRSAAENLAYNMGYADPVSKAVEGWIKSPGHRQNMLGNYNLTGIGVAKNSRGEYYFTQIFVLEP